MALEFDRGNQQYLTRGGAVVTTYPFTVSLWFNAKEVTNRFILFNLGNSGTDNEQFNVSAAGDVANDPLLIEVVVGGVSSNAVTTAGFTANTWYHACGVFTSATSRTIYIDGANSATDTTNLTPSGLDRTTIATANGATVASSSDARIADVGIWSVALDTAEIAALAKRFAPPLIRPASLVAYYTLMRGDSSGTTHFDRWRSSLNVVEGGSGSPTRYDHPATIYPIGA